MRLVHFSDLHLEKDHLASNHFVIHPLINTLKERNLEQKIDLIIFSGDLIDKGGESFDSADVAFIAFYDTIIHPICKAIELPEDRFIICPGNHDVVRNRDNEIIENGCQYTLKDEVGVEGFIAKVKGGGKRLGVERMEAFKAFEEMLYTPSDHCQLSFFGSNFKFKIDSKWIGVAALNSAWRCYDEKDTGKLIIGEEQIRTSLEFLNECDFKFAALHHQFEDLVQFEQENSKTLLQANYDVLLSGHVHKASNKYVIEPKGKLLTLIAPGTLKSNLKADSKTYSNGFSILDINFNQATLNVHFYNYNFPNNKFSLNTVIADEGVWKLDLPKTESVKQEIERRSLVNTIKDEHIGRVDSHLLTFNTDTEAPKCLRDIFVQPKLVVKEDVSRDEEKTIEDLTSILQDDRNYLFFGTKEAGKSTVLDKILLDCLDPSTNTSYVPVFLEFSKISTDITTNIRDYLLISKEGTKEALSNHPILLIIDDIKVSEEYSDLAKIRQIRNLLDKYGKVKLVATYPLLYEGEVPAHIAFLDPFNFITVSIKEFRSRQIRELTSRWFQNAELDDRPKKIETLINGFLGLSLPRTPFTVSMFLWVIEKQQNYKPINNSTLIENFIERLLNKHSKTEIFSEKFDYQNKVRLLSEIAYKMLKADQEDYSETHASIFTFIGGYLKKKEFDFNVEKILNDFIDCGIFVKDGNNLRFRFACFFEYFLVKKMGYDDKFKAEVLAEENYLKFVNEIDYFTGLNRDESSILELVVARLDKAYVGIRDKIDLLEANIDDFFIQTVSKINIPEEKVATLITDSKATEFDYEQIEDERLQAQKSERGISKKDQGSVLDSIAKILILSCKVLKNSEEIEIENLKFNSYKKILYNSVYFAIFYKIYVSTLISKKLIAEEMKDEQLQILQFLPYYHETLLNQNMGTQKLAPIMRGKIDEDMKDKKVSEFELFLSVFLYADVRGKKYFEKLHEFINKANKKYIFDMSFAKIVHYYGFRSKDSESDQQYLNMIGDILVKAKGYKRETKSNLIDRYKAKKREIAEAG